MSTNNKDVREDLKKMWGNMSVIENVSTHNVDKVDFEKLGKKMKDLEIQIEDVKREIDKSKISFIEFCGIFVAIFTFISVDVQILKTISNMHQLMGFVFIFAALLMGFILILDYLINNERNIQKFIIITISLVIFIVIGLFSIFASKNTSNNTENSSMPSIINPPVNNIQLPARMNIRVYQ